MGRLKESATHLKADSQLYSLQIDNLKAKNSDLQNNVSALERAGCDLQMEVNELRNELKELRDEIKKLRDETSRNIRTDAVDSIEEIEEEAPKLKRKRVEIRAIVFAN
jgi:chromosome segregation ATPase